MVVKQRKLYKRLPRRSFTTTNFNSSVFQHKKEAIEYYCLSLCQTSAKRFMYLQRVAFTRQQTYKQIFKIKSI